MGETKNKNLFCNIEKNDGIDDNELRNGINKFLNSIGPRDDVLILPPDITRYHSRAGTITQMITEYYNFIPSSQQIQTETTIPKIEIMPALGTHSPMTKEQIKDMFGNELSSKDNPNPFLVHDWRNDVVTIGYAPKEMVYKATYGLVNEPWPAQVNKLVWSKRYNNESNNDDNNITSNDDKIKKKVPLILSIGQVVPHEVMGMANFNKNIFVGVGGIEAINLSHFIGAVHGMEKLMGKPNNPLRSILNYSSEQFLQPNLDIYYILTVIGSSNKISKSISVSTKTSEQSLQTSSSLLQTTKENNEKNGEEINTKTKPKEKVEEDLSNSSSLLEMKGLFIGNTIECYEKACDLSLRVNFNILPREPKCIVVYLDPKEYHSTWLGNKAIYRTRMAISDNGKLIILAPGVHKFGEDNEIDIVIRKYGYVGTKKIMKILQDNPILKDNSLSAIAHLIHGSSEDRFHITYCPAIEEKGNDKTKENILSKEDIESVGYEYGNYNDMHKLYNLTEQRKAKTGWYNDINGNEFYYITNPALGLWAVKNRMC